MRKLKIAVIGGGLGGLTAAAALHQRGFEVQVFERSPNFGEVGAGIQLGPNGVRVLYALGCRSRLDETACAPQTIMSIAALTGKFRHSEPLSFQSIERFGAPYLTAYRADLHRMLLELLPSSILHNGQTLVSCTQSGDIGIARFDDGSTVEADVIVGADGVRSAVRASLFGDVPPRYTGMTCFRATLPMDVVPKAFGPDGIDMHANAAGWIGQKGHVICYPIRAGKTLNIFAGFHNPQWVDESWTIPSSPSEMLEVYEGWYGDFLKLLAQTEAGHKWGLHDRDPMPAWTKGRMTLLGDAAHPMMPTLAQGACQAIEDGWALSRHLSALPDDVPGALSNYEAERRPRASKVQLQARQQFRNNLLPNPPPNLSRDWIFRFDSVVGKDWQAQPDER